MNSGKGVGLNFVGIENLLDLREVNQGIGCSHYGLLRMSDKLHSLSTVGLETGYRSLGRGLVRRWTSCQGSIRQTFSLSTVGLETGYRSLGRGLARRWTSCQGSI